METKPGVRRLDGSFLAAVPCGGREPADPLPTDREMRLPPCPVTTPSTTKPALRLRLRQLADASRSRVVTAGYQLPPSVTTPDHNFKEMK